MPRRGASRRPEIPPDAVPPKRRGRKGVPNVLSGDMKAVIAEAVRQLGGPAYFVQMGRKYPEAFMALCGKLLPKQMEVGPEGAGSSALRLIVVTGVPKGTQMVSETRGRLLGDPTEIGRGSAS